MRTNINWQQMARSVLDRAIAIQQIPAPTFDELERAQMIAEELRKLDVRDVAVDDVYNVIGTVPGERAGAGVMVAAHLDTVFSREADLRLKDKGNVIYGPGLGDNSLGVASILGLIETLRQAQIIPPVNLHVAITSREEGLGDLGGMRVAYERFKGQIKAVVNIEGLAFGHVFRAGIAVKRLHILATAPGGHSWIHFGKPSATHAIVNLGAAITQLVPPESPRTTYNIGMIEGGQSINSIAAQAGLWLDMRSEDTGTLNALEMQVHEQVVALTTDEVQFDVEVVGQRPAGIVAMDHPLVQMAMQALADVGAQGTLQSGSTDGNIPLADGCPTVTIGITRGGNAHRMDEYVEKKPIALGLEQAFRVILRACELEESSVG
jgi:tripeptide aminopeptidase